MSKQPIRTIKLTLGNLKKFFLDIGYSGLVPPIWIREPPNVTLYKCLYGTDIRPTPEKFLYQVDEFPDTFPKTESGDGDGTVNIRSLQTCHSFLGKQEQQVVIKSFSKVEHI